MTAPDDPTVEEGDVTATAPEDQRRGWWIAAGVVLVLAVVVGLIVLLGGDDEDDGDQAATTTTEAPATTDAATTTDAVTTTTEAPATSGPSPVDPNALWPAQGSTTRFTDPVEAARSFATELLGFTDPVLGEFQQGDARSGEVQVGPTEEGPVTTVFVRQLGPGDDWSVTGAATENIELATPEPGAQITSPTQLTGRAHAFEGTVLVELRQDGDTTPLYSGFVTGGGDQLRDFEGSMTFDAPTAERGVLVLYTQSADDGRVLEATAIRVQFGAAG